MLVISLSVALVLYLPAGVLHGNTGMGLGEDRHVTSWRTFEALKFLEPLGGSLLYYRLGSYL